MLWSAASAIIAASVPAICTAIGPGSPSWLARREVFRLDHKSLRAVIISLTAYPAPSALPSWRNGRWVPPAIGATNNRFGKGMEPICMKREAQAGEGWSQNCTDPGFQQAPSFADPRRSAQRPPMGAACGRRAGPGARPDRAIDRRHRRTGAAALVGVGISADRN